MKVKSIVTLISNDTFLNSDLIIRLPNIFLFKAVNTHKYKEY